MVIGRLASYFMGASRLVPRLSLAYRAKNKETMGASKETMGASYLLGGIV